MASSRTGGRSAGSSARSLPTMRLLVILLPTVASALALNQPPSRTARIAGVGRQPRGNAILRKARRHSTSIPTATPEQTKRLREEAFNNLGLNINDHNLLRSGRIAEAIPEPNLSEEALLRRAEAEAAQERRDKEMRRAERRLEQEVREPSGNGSNARASARLCAALAEARRRGCVNKPLLKKADALLTLLERAAAEEHERQPEPLRRRRSGSVSMCAAAGDDDTEVAIFSFG